MTGYKCLSILCENNSLPGVEFWLNRRFFVVSGGGVGGQGYIQVYKHQAKGILDSKTFQSGEL